MSSGLGYRLSIVTAALLATASCRDSTEPYPELIDVSQSSLSSSDRTPPTTPTNLRTTGTTSFSVSLAWTAARDNSNDFSYRVRHSWGYEVTLPKEQTSYTWTSNLEAGRSYSFVVYAIDRAGNRSRLSNTVNVTLPRDSRPPSTPVVEVTEIGATHVALRWNSTDDGPFVFYTVSKNGTPVLQGISATSGIVRLLEPSTTYSFTVRARDNGINWSPESAPLVVTTAPRDTNDRQAPTAPSNVRIDASWDGELGVTWDQSTDNVDAQPSIRYDVFVNGELSSQVFGRGRTVVYGINGENTVTVIAVDAAGNRSAPGSAKVVLVL